jgi:hypothetical protein
VDGIRRGNERRIGTISAIVPGSAFVVDEDDVVYFLLPSIAMGALKDDFREGTCVSFLVQPVQGGRANGLALWM